MAQVNKLQTAIVLLNKTLQYFPEDTKFNELKYCSLYNLGILFYAIGWYDEAIHHFETAHRLVVENHMSTFSLLQVLEILSLAYISKKAFRKAYTLIHSCIGVRELNNEDPQAQLQTYRLKSYLNYIIECLNYDFGKFKKLEKLSKIDLVRNKEVDLEAESNILIEYVLNESENTKCILDWFSESKIIKINI
jgi:tetratricopeptide (TPR) repeat protein